MLTCMNVSPWLCMLECTIFIMLYPCPSCFMTQSIHPWHGRFLQKHDISLQSKQMQPSVLIMFDYQCQGSNTWQKNIIPIFHLTIFYFSEMFPPCVHLFLIVSVFYLHCFDDENAVHSAMIMEFMEQLLFITWNIKPNIFTMFYYIQVDRDIVHSARAVR